MCAISGCITVEGGDDVGSNCAFPFIFGGKEYNGCTTLFDDDPWCFTLVDDDGVAVNGAGKWGYCGPECKMHTGRIVISI